MAYLYKVISANDISTFESEVQVLLDSTPNDEGYYPLGNVVTSSPPVGDMIFTQSFIRQV